MRPGALKSKRPDGMCVCERAPAAGEKARLRDVRGRTCLSARILTAARAAHSLSAYFTPFRETPVLKRIWITPPLAIGRLGPSDTPSDAFLWSDSPPIHDGAGKTTLRATESFTLDAKGNLTSHIPDEIIFKDAEGIRPVCPFFELHGEWTKGKRLVSGPLTPAILKSEGLSLKDISWRIEAANLKAWHYTFAPGDRIEAKLRIGGADTRVHALEGRPPKGAARPAVRGKGFVALGAVQLAKPSEEFPEIRLRYYAPKGLVYGPTDLARRISGMTLNFGRGNTDANAQNRSFRSFSLPAAQLIVNPASHWARQSIELSKLGPYPGNDERNNPASLFAIIYEPHKGGTPIRRSLGLLDDTSDAVVTCLVKAGGKRLAAQARITVGPPDYSPAGRHPSSIADNLADREDRSGPRSGGWKDEELRDLVHDIFERAFETSGQMNKDAQNDRCIWENSQTLLNLGRTSALDAGDIADLLWPQPGLAAVQNGDADALELTHAGMRKHRRQASLQYLEEHFAEDPDLFKKWIRAPLDTSQYFDRRMPALMRGSDGRPYHLTRRQWEIIAAWVARLQVKAKAAAAAK